MPHSSFGILLVQFLTGHSYLSGEMQSFWMAVQGSMIVRSTRNPDRKQLHWFHAFCLSVLAGYAGGWFGFLIMAKPSSMLYNDLNMAGCILAFLLVNFTPFDVGYKLCQTFPVALVTVSFAQLFRSTAIPRFVDVCYHDFKDRGTPYYPSMPVFGPIMYATLLGNMGGFITKGLEGHVREGMPWPIQNGLITASFYHFYVNDHAGVVGRTLRHLVDPIAIMLGFDNVSTDPAARVAFGACTVSLFMQLMGVLQMPQFLGPNFSPFTTPFAKASREGSSSGDIKVAATAAVPSAVKHSVQPPSVNGTAAGSGPVVTDGTADSTKKKRNKRKKKPKTE